MAIKKVHDQRHTACTNVYNWMRGGVEELKCLKMVFSLRRRENGEKCAIIVITAYLSHFESFSLLCLWFYSVLFCAFCSEFFSFFHIKCVNGFASLCVLNFAEIEIPIFNVAFKVLQKPIMAKMWIVFFFSVHSHKSCALHKICCIQTIGDKKVAFLLLNQKKINRTEYIAKMYWIHRKILFVCIFFKFPMGHFRRGTPSFSLVSSFAVAL